MLSISSPIWQFFPLLQLVHYPFRILSVTIFSASILAAMLIKNIPFKLIFFTPFLLLVLYANRNHLRINEVFSPGEEYYLNLNTTTTSWAEHLPLWSNPASTKSPGKIVITDGLGEIELEQNKSILVSAKITAATDITAQFNQVYYPGWEFFLNDKPLSFTYLKSDSNGMPVFSIPQGEHVFIGKLTKTGPTRIAESLTVLSVVLSLYLVVKKTQKSLWKK